ncbi:MAG: efflux RND transporter periplasmic adaptor subunit [Polyangiales bacterium]
MRAWWFALLLCGCAAKPHDGPHANPLPAPSSSAVRVDPSLVSSGRVALGKVEKRVPSGERRVPGEVRADERGRAEAGTLVAGRVASIEVALFAPVQKGAVLAWIDAPDFGRAVADVLRARARASVAAHKLERQLELEKENATSKNAVDDARAENLVAEADLAAARTALTTIGGAEPVAIGAKLAVRAPIAGIVSRRDVVVGAHVSAEKTLFEIVAPAHVQIVASVPETVAPPPIGIVAKVRPRGSDATCMAKTVGDVGVVDEDTRTRSARLEVVGTCSLVPGAFVDVIFPTTDADAKPALVVPREAVIDVHQSKVVFVTTDHGATFTARTVRSTVVIGADAILEDGVREGEEVAVRGAVLLKGELLRAELE